jgi:hypothetical protein
VFDSGDQVSYDNANHTATGWRESGGGDIYTQPTFISAGDTDYFKTNKSGGGKPGGTKTKGDDSAGRQSWEQIR